MHLTVPGSLFGAPVDHICNREGAVAGARPHGAPPLLVEAQLFLRRAIAAAAAPSAAAPAAAAAALIASAAPAIRAAKCWTAGQQLRCMVQTCSPAAWLFCCQTLEALDAQYAEHSLLSTFAGPDLGSKGSISRGLRGMGRMLSGRLPPSCSSNKSPSS